MIKNSDLKSCIVCGKTLSDQRSNKQYCGNACKQKAYRRMKETGNAMETVKGLETPASNSISGNAKQVERSQEPDIKQMRKWSYEFLPEDWNDKEGLSKCGNTNYTIIEIKFFKNISGLSGLPFYVWIEDFQELHYDSDRDKYLWMKIKNEDTVIGKAFKDFQNQLYKSK